MEWLLIPVLYVGMGLKYAQRDLVDRGVQRTLTVIDWPRRLIRHR